MKYRTSRWIILAVILFWNTSNPLCANDAAINYAYASMELEFFVPEYVSSATTDDPQYGFSKRLSTKQKNFLTTDFVISSLNRFDQATSRSKCDWKRFTTHSWSDARLNTRMHQLARVVLLRARADYEAGNWKKGNKSVEQTRIMARHMVSLARPYEHQCFMIENMAMGTASAYLLDFPPEALNDFRDSHVRLVELTPKQDLYSAEAHRLDKLVRQYDFDKVEKKTVIEIMKPYLSTEMREKFLTASKEELVSECQALVSFMREQAILFNVEYNQMEQKLAQCYSKHSKLSKIVNSWGSPLIDDFKENAQSKCRALMVGEVTKKLMSQNSDFSNIPDPYNSNDQAFELISKPNGFILKSELNYYSEITFQFGAASQRSQE